MDSTDLFQVKKERQEIEVTHSAGNERFTTTRTSQELRPDLLDQISSNLYRCHDTKCRKTFNTTKALFKHSKNHVEQFRRLSCTEPNCDKRFPNKTRLKAHLQTHRAKIQCPMEGCNKTYYKVSNLATHIKKHERKPDFKCPHEGCGRTFYEKGNLKTHYRLHTGEKPYKCSWEGCGSAHISQSHLNLH